jgi:hypothetical protein
MTFTPATPYVDSPSTATPLNAVGLNSRLAEVAAYADTAAALTGASTAHVVAANVTVGAGVDNTAALNAQLTALAASRQQTIVQLPATGSSYVRFLGVVSVPNKVTLWGAGNDVTVPGTRVRLDHADAQIQSLGSGGIFGNFTLDGNNVANYPLVLDGSGAHRTFLNLDVIDAVADNVTVYQQQNLCWVSCFFQGAGNDNLVLDRETGGHVFVRLELNDPGRHNLLITQSRVAPSGYTSPTHIEFVHSILERSNTANPSMKVTAGEQIVLRGCIVQTTQAAPHIEVTAGDVLLDGVSLSGGVSVTSGVKLGGSGAKAIVVGYVTVTATPFLFDVPAGGLVYIFGELRLGSGVARATAATPESSTIITPYKNPLSAGRDRLPDVRVADHQREVRRRGCPDHQHNRPCLDHGTTSGKTSFTMPTVYVGLYTDRYVPSDAGGGTEVSGGSYARKSTAGSDWAAAASGSTSNAAIITFVTASGSWGTVTHFGLFDASTAGNLLEWAALTTSKTISNGDVASFPIGNLVRTLD